MRALVTVNDYELPTVVEIYKLFYVEHKDVLALSIAATQPGATHQYHVDID